MSRMFSIVVMAGVAGLLLSSQVFGQISQGPTGNYYEAVIVLHISWNEANTDAQQSIFDSKKGHLAIITSQEEDIFLELLRQNVVRKNGLENFDRQEFWVGGFQPPNQSSPKTGWRWVNNEGQILGTNGGALYANWLPGEPNDYSSPEEDNEENHLVIGYFGQAGWNDNDSYPQFILGYIVEFENPQTSSILANSVVQFSGVQGENSWFYGYYNQSQDPDALYQITDFQELPLYSPGNIWEGQIWELELGPGPPWTALGSEWGHPNGPPHGETHWAVRRWVSNYSGEVQITGESGKTWFGMGGGDGTEVAILINGSEVFSRVVQADDDNRTPFSLSTILNVNSLLDFVIRPQSTDDFDSTAFYARISTIQIIDQPPQITHTPITSALRGKEILFSMEITDDKNQLKTLVIYARVTGERDFIPHPIVVRPGQTHFEMGISNLTQTLDGVEYYIVAADSQGLIARHGTPESPHRITIVDPCLEISNQIDADNDGRSDREECYHGTNPNIPQAQPVSRPGQRNVLGNINPDYPTIVLTHGLQPKNQDIDELWTGTGQRQAATLIHNALGDRADKINIVQYIWEEAFQVKGLPDRDEYTRARAHALDSGIRLAHELFRAFGKNYRQPIHFIGHSLGSVVNTYACEELLNELPNVSLVQFTALDRPHHVHKIGMTLKEEEQLGYDSDFFTTNLPVSRTDLQLKIDNYYSDPNADFSVGVGDIANGPVYNHIPLVNSNDVDDFVFNEGVLFGIISNDHSGIQQWYRWTINPNGLREKTCIGENEDTFNRPIFAPRMDESLNPCHQGWYWSLFGAAPDDFPENNGTPLLMDVASLLQLTESKEYGCHITTEDQITVIRCDEASSPFVVSEADIPQKADFFSFEYQFTSSGDGDYAALLLSDTPIWVLSGGSVSSNIWLKSGNIPIKGYSGRQRLTVALYGVGSPNFGFRVRNISTFSVIRQNPFIRGDSNSDGKTDISDAINILNWLFLGTGNLSCEDAGDTNDNGEVDISDAIYLLGYLFTGANPSPLAPYPTIGSDPTEDELGCEDY